MATEPRGEPGESLEDTERRLGRMRVLGVIVHGEPYGRYDDYAKETIALAGGTWDGWGMGMSGPVGVEEPMGIRDYWFYASDNTWLRVKGVFTTLGFDFIAKSDHAPKP